MYFVSGSSVAWREKAVVRRLQPKKSAETAAETLYDTTAVHYDGPNQTTNDDNNKSITNLLLIYVRETHIPSSVTIGREGNFREAP